MYGWWSVTELSSQQGALQEQTGVEMECRAGCRCPTVSVVRGKATQRRERRNDSLLEGTNPSPSTNEMSQDTESCQLCFYWAQPRPAKSLLQLWESSFPYFLCSFFLPSYQESGWRASSRSSFPLSDPLLRCCQRSPAGGRVPGRQVSACVWAPLLICSRVHKDIFYNINYIYKCKIR